MALNCVQENWAKLHDNMKYSCGHALDIDNKEGDLVQDRNLRAACSVLIGTIAVHTILATRMVTVPLNATLLNESYTGANSKECVV